MPPTKKTTSKPAKKHRAKDVPPAPEYLSVRLVAPEPTEGETRAANERRAVDVLGALAHGHLRHALATGEAAGVVRGRVLAAVAFALRGGGAQLAGADAWARTVVEDSLRSGIDAAKNLESVPLLGALQALVALGWDAKGEARQTKPWREWFLEWVRAAVVGASRVGGNKRAQFVYLAERVVDAVLQGFGHLPGLHIERTDAGAPIASRHPAERVALDLSRWLQANVDLEELAGRVEREPASLRTSNDVEKIARRALRLSGMPDGEINNLFRGGS